MRRAFLTYDQRLLLIIIEKLTCLENEMSELRDELTATEAALQSAISDLAARISALPAAEDITQDDIDGLKADVANLAAISPATDDGSTPSA